MKARDSGMPEEQMWASFFDAPRMLAALGFTGIKGNVADFGCGYPWMPPLTMPGITRRALALCPM